MQAFYIFLLCNPLRSNQIPSLLIFESLLETYRKEILQLKLIMVEGNLQIEGEVIHVIVKKCFNFSGLLRSLTPAVTEDPLQLSMSRSDEKSIPVHAQNKRSPVREEKGEEVFSGGRNFR